MITDIPTSSDFQNAGINLLNLSWDSTMSLLTERIVEIDKINTNASVNETYWKSAQPILTSSLTLIQQGVEFFLKGKISEISPYLLIANMPSNFPKNSNKQNTPFSDFRTLDAQDLIRVHDTVSENRLSDEFCQWYDELRRLRNKLMHTVDNTLFITDKDILIKVMEGCDYCLEHQSWIDVRSRYLANSPGGHLVQFIPSEQMDDDEKAAYHLGQLQSEIMTVIEYLEPQYSKRFFGFQRKQRRYICLHCLSVREHESFFEYKDLQEVWLKTAQLVGSGLPQPNAVHCIFCNGDYLIKREKCNNCGNDVNDAHNGLCLSCTGHIPKNIELQSPTRIIP